MVQTENLSKKKCKPCEGIGKSLSATEAGEFAAKVPGWNLREDSKLISRDFLMRNFMAAVEFINRVASIAESENHHPDIHLSEYRKLRIELSTHALGGLSENDFIVASKINELPVALKT